MESIFLHDDKGVGEKRYRLANRGAWFLGKTFEKRKDYFKTLKTVYDYASSVIHAGTPKEKKQYELSETISDAQDLCKDAILQVALERDTGLD